MPGRVLGESCVATLGDYSKPLVHHLLLCGSFRLQQRCAWFQDSSVQLPLLASIDRGEYKVSCGKDLGQPFTEL